MEKSFIEKMEKELLNQKKTILDSLASKNDDLKKLIETVDSGDVVDIASDVTDGQLLESLGVQDTNRLHMINNALDRIKQGTYGHCLKCGVEIPESRLEVIPYAFLCINCKSQDERNNR